MKTEELICRKTKKARKNTENLKNNINFQILVAPCQMSKADAGHVDFVIHCTIIKKWTIKNMHRFIYTKIFEL
jgi:hypothetical protein